MTKDTNKPSSTEHLTPLSTQREEKSETGSDYKVDSLSSFRTLLHASFKSEDTEEWLDVYFTRPIGLAFALLWRRLGVTPNAVTILSIFLGVGAGVMFYFTDTLHNIIGIILLMLANFCDSTDGQLARLTNQRSMKGRCLDGFAGDVWFVAIYLAIVLRIWHQPIPGTSMSWGLWGLALAALAGFLSHSPQCSLSDYYRQIHLYFLKGRAGSELDSYEKEHAIVESLKGKKDVFWDRAFHFNYQHYCKSQEHRTPDFQRFHKALLARYGSIEQVPQDLKGRFLVGSRPLMPFTNLLTFNCRGILVYVTCLLNCPWVYLLVEVTLLNLAYVYMHKKHEALCREELNRLLSSSERGATVREKSVVYLFDFGGTLDTGGCHWGKMLWHGYERQDIPVSEAQFREAYVHAERTLGKQPIIKKEYTFRQMLEAKLQIEFDYLSAQGWLNVDAEMARQMQTRLLADLYNKVKITIEANKCVLLQLQPQHRLGLVTNFYGNMSVVLKEFGLSNLFQTVTESAVVGVRKPDPQIFQRAAETLGVSPSDAVVVGDSYTKDILPAHSIGCQTVWIKGEGWTNDEPSDCIADVIIHDLSELLVVKDKLKERISG